MCGVHTTLSSASSGSCASMSGSLSYTSTAAMPGRPTRSAATSAPGAINPARLVLTRSADGFMRERSSAVTIPRVAGTSRMWSDSTSHAAKNVCLSGATGQPSARARAIDSGRAHASTSMPNALP